MSWSHLIAYFFGGIFAANAIPHLCAGLMGRPFQSPFAKPRGRGLSSSLTNVLWGWLNAAASYGLIARVGEFNARSFDALAVLLGALALSWHCSRHFGALHGGYPVKASPGATVESR